MAWHDDSWKDSYDAWKLASPDDEYDDPCDHEDYDVDILEGRARCHRCGESWYCSEEEVLRQIDAESAYARYLEEEDRKQWWRDLFAPITGPLRRLRWRWKGAPKIDDDIPF